MEHFEPEKIISRERARRSFSIARLSDDELLRQQERLFNGLTIVLGLAILPTWFFGGSLGTFGMFFAIAAEIIMARHYNRLGNQCREAREILKTRLH